MKKLLFALCLILLGSPANAQYNTNAMYCNSQVSGFATPSGNTQILTAPSLQGGIFICGYNLATNSASVTATIGYGTATTGAAFTSITLPWPLTSTAPFAEDTSPVFRGIYVPPGQNVLLNLSAAGQVGWSVYFTYQQNR